jgi:hypothetical protein
MSLFLYSVNPWLVWHVCERHRNGKHVVWCSEVFDARHEGRLAASRFVPPSSNPAELYGQWRQETERGDRHSGLINRVSNKLVGLATTWQENGEIAEADLQEITYHCLNGRMEVWRPLLYVIDRRAVATRLTLVPPDERAGFGNEYRLGDLTRQEFDTLELPV